MQSIAICDDDEFCLSELEAYCLDYFKHQCNIRIFHSGEALLYNLSDSEWDIILLDIDMPGLNGLDIKNTLQHRHIKSQIIFVTGHERFMKDAFGIYVSGYLIKPVDKMKLFHLLEQICVFQNYHRELKLIDIRNNMVEIRLSDIVYIRAERAYSRIIKKNHDEIVVSKGIGEWEHQLEDSGFCRCHKSFLVNLAYVRNIDHPTFIKCMDTQIPIGRSRRAILRRMYIEYQYKTAR